MLYQIFTTSLEQKTSWFWVKMAHWKDIAINKPSYFYFDIDMQNQISEIDLTPLINKVESLDNKMGTQQVTLSQQQASIGGNSRSL